MTEPKLSNRRPEGETVLWEGHPSAQSFIPRIVLPGIIIIVGLSLLLTPLGAAAGLGDSIGERMLPALFVTAVGAMMGFGFWRDRPGNVHYQLTDRQLRLFRGDQLARRYVRGELRNLGLIRELLTGGGVGLVKTMIFTGNPSGLTQRGLKIYGLADAEQVLARIANWTTGDEEHSETAAAEFNADPEAGGRTLQNPRHRLQLRVPADWPLEARDIESVQAQALGKQLPVRTIRLGALLPLNDDSGAWDGLRVRASDRAGFWLEISNRTSERDLEEARHRWQVMGPIDAEAETVSLAGFRGVMVEQPPSDPAPPPPRVEPGRAWARDGAEDERFGFVGEGAHRIMLWATDGKIAISMRAYAPSPDSESARAIRRVIESIRVEGEGNGAR